MKRQTASPYSKTPRLDLNWSGPPDFENDARAAALYALYVWIWVEGLGNRDPVGRKVKGWLDDMGFNEYGRSVDIWRLAGDFYAQIEADPDKPHAEFLQEALRRPSNAQRQASTRLRFENLHPEVIRACGRLDVKSHTFPLTVSNTYTRYVPPDRQSGLKSFCAVVYVGSNRGNTVEVHHGEGDPNSSRNDVDNPNAPNIPLADGLVILKGYQNSYDAELICTAKTQEMFLQQQMSRRASKWQTKNWGALPRTVQDVLRKFLFEGHVIDVWISNTYEMAPVGNLKLPTLFALVDLAKEQVLDLKKLKASPGGPDGPPRGVEKPLSDGHVVVIGQADGYRNCNLVCTPATFKSLSQKPKPKPKWGASTLHERAVRLAYQNPGPVRDALMPILMRQSSSKEGSGQFFEIVDEKGDFIFEGSRDDLVRGVDEDEDFGYFIINESKHLAVGESATFRNNGPFSSRVRGSLTLTRTQ